MISLIKTKIKIILELSNLTFLTISVTATFLRYVFITYKITFFSEIQPKTVKVFLAVAVYNPRHSSTISRVGVKDVEKSSKCNLIHL